MRCLPFLAILISPLFLTAQSVDFDTATVVTTRLPQTLERTGRNISVLPGTQLRQSAYVSLDDLLQYYPGIEVQTRNAFGAQGDISMRGSTFTQVLVLVNGMRLNDPLTGHFNGYIPVTPGEIERIEVLRGAASALYGADAVGGVINVITKQFGETDGATVQGQLNYGDHRLVNAQQGFHLQRDRLYVSGGFQTNQSAGEPIAGRTFTPAGSTTETTLEAYDNFFNLKTIGLAAGYQLSDNWELHARSGYDARNFAARYFYTTSPFDKSTETTQNWFNQMRLTNRTGNSQTDVQLAHRFGTDVFVFSPDFPSTNVHTTQFWNANVNHRRYLNENFAINLGVQADRRSIESTDRGNHDDNHFGVYAVGSYRVNAQLDLNTSLRLDNDDNYGTEFTPQLSIAYRPDAVWTLRAAAGRSIRAADYTERFVSFNLANVPPEELGDRPRFTPGRSLGNPDLRAESAWSEEIGVDARPFEGWLLRGTAFFRQSDDLIDFVATNQRDIPNANNLEDGADYFLATNIASVRTTGVELESWWNGSVGTNATLSWSLGYTFLNTTNEEGVVSVYISSHARHLITSNLIFQAGDWRLALSGVHKRRDDRSAAGIDAELEPSYTLVNLRAGYELTNGFGLNAQLHNLFDAEYADILGAPLPGRWFMGGFVFNLNGK